MLNAVVDAQRLTQGRADHHADNDAENVPRADGAGDADQRRAEAESLHQRMLQALLQAIAQEDAQKAAGDDRRHIHEYRNHSEMIPPSSALRYKIACR